MTNATDLAGNPRIISGRVDMGAYEFNPLYHATGAITAILSADYTNAAPGGGIAFAAAVTGRATGCVWQWDDGMTSANVFNTSHAFQTVGVHTATFTAWNYGSTNSVEFTIYVAPAATHYVSLAGGHIPPFTNWSSAATNIQAAIDVAFPADNVLVASGVYSYGDAFAAGAPNRVSLGKALTVASVGGPGETILLADYGSGGRGAFVGSGTLLAGFTITNGSAGGVWCETGGGVSNCIIVGNYSYSAGGGVCGGTLWRCTIGHNTVWMDEANPLGGGVLDAVLYDCLVVSNTAAGGYYFNDEYYPLPGFGGGVYGGTLVNCTVVGNDVVGNDAVAGYDGLGSGTYASTLTNCIVYGNIGATNDVEGGSASYSCLPALSVPGVGNITNNPAFLSPATGNYTPAYYSPCINVGTNADWMIGGVDLAGLPRIVNSIVDMGAYEYQGGGSPVITASLLLSPLRLRLEWISVPGKRQQLQSAPSLPAATWLDEGVPFVGTGVMSTNIPIGPGVNRFFRLEVKD